MIALATQIQGASERRPLGDSFTFGSEVDNTTTWEFQLEERDARFEVLNFSGGAYGLDRAHLRYIQDEGNFNSDIVVIEYMSENIYCNLNVFRMEKPSERKMVQI